MKRRKVWKKIGVSLLALTMTAGLLAGCKDKDSASAPDDAGGTQTAEDASASAEWEKVFYYGDTEGF